MYLWAYSSTGLQVEIRGQLSSSLSTVGSEFCTQVACKLVYTCSHLAGPETILHREENDENHFNCWIWLVQLFARNKYFTNTGYSS